MSSTTVSIARAPDEAPTAAALASLADDSGAPSYSAGRIIVALSFQDGQITPLASIYGAPFFALPSIPLTKLATGPQGAASFDIRNAWPVTVDRNGAKTYHRPAFHNSAKVTLPRGASTPPAKGSFLDRIFKKTKP